MSMSDADLLRLLRDDRFVIDFEGWWLDLDGDGSHDDQIRAGADEHCFVATTIRDALEGLLYVAAYDWWAMVCDDEEDEAP